MQFESFWQEMDRRIAAYDLLCHPFYKAWTAGELTREDLYSYAQQYYPHVAAFPEYLGALAARTSEGPTRAAILMNQADELGEGSADGRSHAELWLDFVEGMGAGRKLSGNLPEIEVLIAHFRSVARNGRIGEALAAFYAYESQVPRVAREKACGLKEMYGADEQTCRYFTLHTMADVHHAQVWRELIEREVKDEDDATCALQAAENAARALWQALDGIERKRVGRSQAA